MKPTGFESAFDSVADAVARAAALPDHRERPVETPRVTCQSPRGEVVVTVHDGKVESLWLNDMWLEGALTDDVAALITQVTNEALELWGDQHLAQLQEITPEMKELHAAISVARSQLEDAWVATLAKAKN